MPETTPATTARSVNSGSDGSSASAAGGDVSWLMPSSGEAGFWASPAEGVKPRGARAGLLPLETEPHRHLHDHRHRHAVEERGTVHPLRDRGQRGPVQEGGAL